MSALAEETGFLTVAEFAARLRVSEPTIYRRVADGEHVAKNRRRFVRDVEKAKEKAAGEYRRLVDELEGKRHDVLELQATQIWATLFPSETLPERAQRAGARRCSQGGPGAAPPRC